LSAGTRPPLKPSNDAKDQLPPGEETHGSCIQGELVHTWSQILHGERTVLFVGQSTGRNDSAATDDRVAKKGSGAPGVLRPCGSMQRSK
jgi:hypothetical protein